MIFYQGTALRRVVGFTEENALLIGSVGRAVSLGILTFIFGTAEVSAETGHPVLSDAAGWAALISTNTWVFSFGFPWGPVVWVLLGEMLSNKIRAAARSLAAAMQWVANFVVSTTFPPITLNLGLGIAYGTHTFFAVLSIFFVMTLNLVGRLVSPVTLRAPRAGGDVALFEGRRAQTEAQRQGRPGQGHGQGQCQRENRQGW